MVGPIAVRSFSPGWTTFPVDALAARELHRRLGGPTGERGAELHGVEVDRASALAQEGDRAAIRREDAVPALAVRRDRDVAPRLHLDRVHVVAAAQMAEGVDDPHAVG